MRLTFKYPVYPTQTQETGLLRWLDHLCELQNSARHDRIVAKEVEDRFVSLSEQQDKLTVAREKYDDFREVPQDFQNHALRRNDKTAGSSIPIVAPALLSLRHPYSVCTARDATLILSCV